MILANGYRIEEMSAKDFFPLFGKHYESLFGGHHTFFHDSPEAEGDLQDKLKKLKARMGDPYKLHLGLFSPENEFVGFSFGFQESEETFYMACSGVLPDHREKGLYSELVKYIIERTTEEGFQKIYGTHCATNNAVLIPKLKLGFIFSKVELSETFGTILHLQYFNNPLSRKIMDYRSGLTVPDQVVQSVMKFTQNK